MIVNPDVVDVHTKRKHPEKRKKQPLTENQKHTKYQNVSWGVPVFTFSLPISYVSYAIPVSYATGPTSLLTFPVASHPPQMFGEVVGC